MKRIALIHYLLIAAAVIVFVFAMLCWSAEARGPYRTYLCEQVVRVEHSVLVPTCPGRDGTLTQWETYLAKKLDNINRDSILTTCRTGWLTSTGEKIDLWMEHAPLAGADGKRTLEAIEVTRPSSAKIGLARLGRIKYRTGADLATLILVVKDFPAERAYILDARDACAAFGVALKTVDAKGVIR